MDIGIKFSKARAQYFLDCIEKGKAIECRDPSGWAGEDLLALAGACLFKGGRLCCLEALKRTERYRTLHREHVEAEIESGPIDALVAVNFLMELTCAVANGRYDEQGFAPTCEGTLHFDNRKGGPILIPGEGMPKG